MKKLIQLLQRFLQNWPAKILSLAAAIFLYLFYTVTSLEQRYFTVPLELRLADGYVVSASYPRSVRVSLRGDGDTVFQVLEEEIHAYADFSVHASEGIFRAPVNYSLTGRAQETGALEISIEPREVTLEIDRLGHRTVEVFPAMTGYPAKGYELTQYLINPSTIQVAGPQGHLNNLSTVVTEEVDLTGRTNDFTQRVSLGNQDPFLFFPGGNTVEFWGFIRETVMTKVFSGVNLVYLDLDDRLAVENTTEKGTIRIQGPELTLDMLNSEDLFISVDCSDIDRPGIHTVEPRPEIPGGLNLLAWTPERLTIRVSEAQTEDQ